MTYQGLTDSIADIEDVTEQPALPGSLNGGLPGLSETDLQMLLHQVSKDKFKAPEMPWDIRAAAEKFRNNQEQDQIEEIKDVSFFFKSLITKKGKILLLKWLRKVGVITSL